MYFLCVRLSVRSIIATSVNAILALFCASRRALFFAKYSRGLALTLFRVRRITLNVSTILSFIFRPRRLFRAMPRCSRLPFQL